MGPKKAFDTIGEKLTIFLKPMQIYDINRVIGNTIKNSGINEFPTSLKHISCCNGSNEQGRLNRK